MPFDTHVHFFTRSLLSDSAGRWLSILRSAALAEGLMRREDYSGAADPAALVDALDAGLGRSSDEVMRSMDSSYGESWSYVPLMVDLEYALEEIPGSPFRGGMSSWPEPVRSGRDENDKEFQLRHRIWGYVERTWKTLSGDGLEAGARRMLAGDSFDIQRNDLTALKASHPEKVFPFLGIDPRRHHAGGIDLCEMVGDFVGPGRPFAGVKLYSAGGFSPTDPSLFGSRGLYRHCRRRRIPITVHFAAGGFATPLSSVRVRGDVFHPFYGTIAEVEEVYSDGRVNFREKMTPGNIRPAVAERQVVLNHPLLWEKVLDRWPGLKINFAHCGGDGQSVPWLARPGGGDWMSWALRQAARRRGVYVDLSSHTGSEVDLQVMAAAIRRRHPILRRKILYGSDYFLSIIKEPDARLFRDLHREAFGTWWRGLSVSNPRRFLAGGTGSRPTGV